MLAAVGSARVLAVFTENVNWDETALLERAVLTGRTGEVIGGGRPGLGTMVLTPFAAECRNAVDALVQARMLWTLMVVGSIVAFWYLLRGVLRPTPHRWWAVATGVGLWVLAPPFLRFSTQVRTDQPAILFGLLAGLALLASRRVVAWAIAGGILLGIGFLFSQKLLYVAGLVGAMSAAQLFIRREWDLGRLVMRAGLAALGFGLVLAGYRQLVPASPDAPSLLPVGAGLSSFDYYREVIGWAYYRVMVPFLVPQLLAVAGLLALTVATARRGRPDREIVVGWVVLALGVAVLGFHAGRFPYFYLVLGLFPAVVGAMVTASALDRLVDPRHRAVFLACLWLPLSILAFMQAASLTLDSQSHQRADLAFVDRSFPPDARGFGPRGEFACRPDPDPFLTRFYQQVVAEFGGPDGTRRGRELMDEFRRRPVAFMIPPRDDEPYPAEVHGFWRTRFVPYHGAVRVAGREVEGEREWTGTFEVIAPGDYVWRSRPGMAGPLEVDGARVGPGGTVRLGSPGIRRLRLPEGGAGMLVLDLPEPPSPDVRPFFRRF